MFATVNTYNRSRTYTFEDPCLRFCLFVAWHQLLILSSSQTTSIVPRGKLLAGDGAGDAPS